MAKSTAKSPRRKANSFPLFRHGNGQWAKKVRGKHHYFGRIADDPDGQQALALWLDQRDDLLAGRTPRVNRDGLTVAMAADAFLSVKLKLVDSGELAAGTFREYFRTCEMVVKVFGRNRLVGDLRPEDFEVLREHLSGNYGPIRLVNEIQRVRSIFKYAFESGLIEHPVRVGPNFKAPSRRVLRLARAQAGERMLEAHEIRKLLGVASPAWRAKILLAVNCGLGNSDVAVLEKTHLDLDRGMLNLVRHKTGISRRVPLWPETVQALRAALATRPKPKNPAHNSLVFLNQWGKPWGEDGKLHAETKRASAPRNSIARGFRRLLDATTLHRQRIGFYTLRHVHRTISDEVGDPPACDAIMGHARDDMASVYRERISDERLWRVVNYVRVWLFGE